MDNDQFQRLLWMLEALRCEIRAQTLVHQRTESAAMALEIQKTAADNCARAAGAFNAG